MSKEVLIAKTKSAAGNLDRKLWIGGILVLILLLSFALFKMINKPQNQTAHTPLVRTERVAFAADALSFTYSGEVHARYETILAFQIGGKIIQRNVELGSAVRAGDVLFAIDPKDIREGVNSAGATVAAARSQLRLAEVNLERYRKLYESGAVSQAEVDRAQTTYETTEASLNQALAGYSTVGNQLDYSRLVANANGVVAEVSAEVGQVVAAGQKVITLVQDGEMEIEINVPENRLDELQKAQDLTVNFWALKDVTVKGKVREIAPMADKAARTYKVRISLAEAAPQVKLGMTAKVAVAPKNGKVLAYIPLSAIYHSGDTPSVWVVKDHAVTLVPVRVGRFADNKVEIQEGLENGAVVVTAGVHKLQEGEKVRIAGEGQ
ncbi:efflux RND transporter periplasmic adaptor subunit [Anaerosporomusa subterranea]|uniref:efflux RND transporter periplasmic adaptor subunit n=1 Tax=Anaerosporomusa subterranea TaxID=1794912 RepID=UPI0012E7248E|nr:efflux RND transporter periplasmic adaptor subunit [Anaerosporomusa subterranea]